MDFDMITSRQGVPAGAAAVGSSDANVSGAGPKSFRRTLSNSSGASEGRRLGRPTSMPPLPAIDYKLPRASVTKLSDHQSNKRQPGGGGAGAKGSRKAIRTPSGKNMSATEYLRGGYRPSEKSLSEEG